MKKLNVCVLFGGISPEYEVSLRSAESVLSNLDPEKYNIFPVGITREGDWYLFGGNDYSQLPAGTWLEHPNNRKATISPIRGQGLLSFEGDCVVRELAGIPYVGSNVACSAVSMDKTLTKLVADCEQVVQAQWVLVRRKDLQHRQEDLIQKVEQKLLQF